MLQFKMGLHASLAGLGTPTSAGTVYVTTDEKAIYVDVPKGEGFERVRMGDVIQVSNVGELESYAPDYSTTALYYVIDQNALLKYVGVIDGKHKWNQINTVSDVTANLNELTTKVNGIETTVAGHTTTIGEHTAAIGKASTEGQVGTGLYREIELLDGRLDVVEPKVKTLEDTLGTKAEGDTSDATVFERLAANATAAANAQSTADGNKTDIAALNKTVNEANTGLVDRVTALETADTNMGTRVDGIEDRVEANENLIGTRAGDDTKSLFAHVYANAEAIGTVQSTANTNKTDIAALTTKVGSDEEGKESGALGDIKTLKADVDAVELALGTKEATADPAGSAFARIASVAGKVGTDADNASADGSLYARVKQNAADIKTAKDGISANGLAIANVKTTAEAADVLSKANQNLIGTKGDSKEVDTAFGRIAKNAADITALSTRVKTAEDEIDALQETVQGIATNTADIVTINKKLAGIGENETVVGKINDLKTELQAEIDKDINAANAMNFKEGIDEYSKLPTENVKVGDTYVVLKGFDKEINGESVRFNAGDLLVATGDETVEVEVKDGENVIGTEMVINPATLVWNHVRTGYVDAHEAKLTGAGNFIKLTSHLGADLGQVKFVSSNENLKVAVADNQVTLGLEWGTF
jgi:predicted  nucleic acid-binding Zn-ribbon protein